MHAYSILFCILFKTNSDKLTLHPEFGPAMVQTHELWTMNKTFHAPEVIFLCGCQDCLCYPINLLSIRLGKLSRN